MNLLYCGDINVRQGVYMSALSVAQNTKEPLNIYILTASVENHHAIPTEFENILSKKLKEKNEYSSVTLLDISEMFDSFKPTANMSTRFTPLCMLRLFSDMIEKIPEKILYLDCDVMCHSDCAEFYHTDISDVEIVGVPDRYGKWFFNNIFLHNYLNSGVLLMNMENIRKSGLFRKCRQMCASKKMFMPDQSALNKLAKKKKASTKYNEQRHTKDDTVFRHFTTYFEFLPYFHAVTIKPWEKEKLHDKFKIYEFDNIIDDYEKEFLK